MNEFEQILDDIFDVMGFIVLNQKEFNPIDVESYQDDFFLTFFCSNEQMAMGIFQVMKNYLLTHQDQDLMEFKKEITKTKPMNGNQLDVALFEISQITKSLPMIPNIEIDSLTTTLDKKLFFFNFFNDEFKEGELIEHIKNKGMEDSWDRRVGFRLRPENIQFIINQFDRMVNQ